MEIVVIGTRLGGWGIRPGKSQHDVSTQVRLTQAQSHLCLHSEHAPTPLEPPGVVVVNWIDWYAVDNIKRVFTIIQIYMFVYKPMFVNFEMFTQWSLFFL